MLKLESRSMTTLISSYDKQRSQAIRLKPKYVRKRKSRQHHQEIPLSMVSESLLLSLSAWLPSQPTSSPSSTPPEQHARANTCAE